jgi:hypothetical protein
MIKASHLAKSCVILGAAVALGGAAPPPLTPAGWGALKIGATESEARKALAPFEIEGDPTDQTYEGCHHINSKRYPGLAAMIQKGRVTRLSLWSDSKTLKTDKGLGVGATEAQVKRAYGPKLEVTEHAYEGPDGHYLTYWAVPRKRGVRYETDVHGRVSAVHVGDQTIQLVEGCS